MTGTVRGFAYSALDQLRGGRQASILREIGEVQRGGEQAERLRESWLRRVLDHATATTDAYRHIGPGSPLRAFHVIDKNDIRENTDAMQSSAFRGQQLATASTSGSTGTPLIVQQDTAKRQRRSAEAIYFGRLAGYELGIRLYNLKIWSGRNHQSRLTHFVRNTRPIDAITFGDAEIAAFVQELQSSSRPAAIIAYASALDRIARYLEDRDLTVQTPVNAVTAQSEALSEETRERLQRRMGVTPVARYGMEEVGIVGQQTASSSDYPINRAGAHVEVLSLSSDLPAAPGELGRIVVTDLHNSAMPMIRYDTGDLGSFAVTEAGEIDPTRLATVEGRKLDALYDADDQHVSSFVFYKVVWKYPGIRQFQIIQTGKGAYTIRLNVSSSFVGERQLIQDFAAHLGATAKIDVHYVDEIPALRSGKRQQVVNHYRP